MPDVSVRICGLAGGMEVVAVPLDLEEVRGNPTLGGLLNHVESKLGCKAERARADALQELGDNIPIEQYFHSLFAFTCPLQQVCDIEVLISCDSGRSSSLGLCFLAFVNGML